MDIGKHCVDMWKPRILPFCCKWSNVSSVRRSNDNSYEWMHRSHLLSSSRRCNMDYLIREISFLPLCSPARTFMLLMTLRHPASTFNFASSYLLIASFLRFSAALSSFSCSVRARYSSNCRLPSALRAVLSCHSRSCMWAKLRSFRGGCFGCVPLPRGCGEWSHPLRTCRTRHHRQEWPRVFPGVCLFGRRKRRPVNCWCLHGWRGTGWLCGCLWELKSIVVLLLDHCANRGLFIKLIVSEIFVHAWDSLTFKLILYRFKTNCQKIQLNTYTG